MYDNSPNSFKKSYLANYDEIFHRSSGFYYLSSGQENFRVSCLNFLFGFLGSFWQEIGYGRQAGAKGSGVLKSNQKVTHSVKVLGQLLPRNNIFKNSGLKTQFHTLFYQYVWLIEFHNVQCIVYTIHVIIALAYPFLNIYSHVPKLVSPAIFEIIWWNF